MRRTVPAIFIDTNVPIYAAGRPHRYKQPSIEVNALVSHNVEQFVTDAEVLQELIHRYYSIKLWHTGRQVFDEFSTIMAGHIEPILPQDAQLAANLVDAHPRLDARDLIHLAVMHRLGAIRIVTTDGDFKDIPGIERLDRRTSRYGEPPSSEQASAPPGLGLCLRSRIGRPCTALAGCGR
jgi:uncharacterized protein